jgi:hypothetical protein
MILGRRVSLGFAVCVLGFISVAAVPAQQVSPANAGQSDAINVYAAFLNTYPGLGQGSRLLIADKTLTFVCGSEGDNGFSMGGCNGLRSNDESPSDRMAIVKRDLPELNASTVLAFVSLNEHSVTIHERIPALPTYYYFSDSDLPKGWKYTHLVYFSSVGFNPEHTQALLNVGIFSATDQRDSKGAYFILTKQSGKWVLGASSAIWQMTP